ncbi:hypothetical protein [Inquilinus sp. Marseille-Q2685]|uniref:hypothetical protein n=1 Tax=Inquilinus sp. Marseille-Q2685 TaxID=2866581 RepID=UPI001CE3C40A|nr:hypothetical protein [Inquilinus sp. Marseille-Q2685]
MNEQPKFNVEDEFAEAIRSIGGFRVTELLGMSPGHPNADFAFPADSVVAELKCLDKDQINDARIIEKASELYVEELVAGRAPVVAFGDVHMTTAGFSEEHVRKIAGLYRVPVERVVKKAAVQIENTVGPLDISEPIGFLLLANDNHSALDPAHMAALVNEILAKPDYSSIDIAILFSGNLAAAFPGSSHRVDYWIVIGRRTITPELHEFIVRLREAWLSRLEIIFGNKRSYAGPGDMQTLINLETRRDTTLGKFR